MTLEISFHRAAMAEFIEASVWYGSKRQNLGRQFIAEIERCVTLATEQPSQFTIAHKDIRRVIAKRFPYSVSPFRTSPHSGFSRISRQKGSRHLAREEISFEFIR